MTNTNDTNAANTGEVMNVKQYAHKKVKSLLEIGARCHKTRSWLYAPSGSPCISVFEAEGNQLANDLKIRETQLLAPHLAKIKRYECALWKLSCLGNGNLPGNSDGNMIAREALSETTPATPHESQTISEMESTRYIPMDLPDDGGKGQRDLIRRLNVENRELKEQLAKADTKIKGFEDLQFKCCAENDYMREQLAKAEGRIKELETPEWWIDEDNEGREDWTDALNDAHPLKVYEVRGATEVYRGYAVQFPVWNEEVENFDDDHGGRKLFPTLEEANKAIDEYKALSDTAGSEGQGRG